MAITGGTTRRFVQDALNLAIASGDIIKAAFYSSSASIGPTTQTYTASGEVTNSPNIQSGGVTLTGRVIGDGTLAVAYVDWDDINVTVTGTFVARGLLIYNASRGNASIGVVDFGVDKSSTNGPFIVSIPTSGSGTGFVRLTPS